VNILVLVKAVPLVGEERLDGDWRTDRSDLEPNGADEYCLERALQLAEASAGEVSVLTMGPTGATEALRKALAMGAAQAYHVDDAALAGSDIRATVAVLEAAVRRIDFDLLFAGADSSDGQGGVVGAALAARLDLPYLGNAADVQLTEGVVRIKRLNSAGHDVLEAPLPAVVMGMQLLGEPRYPSLRGIMGARKKPTTTWTLGDLGLDPGAVGGASATTTVQRAVSAPERGGGTVIDLPPDQAAAAIVEFLDQKGLL
jgi:electron transfer flavoprotein beta subunit